jgi:hypothetical protein
MGHADSLTGRGKDGPIPGGQSSICQLEPLACRRRGLWRRQRPGRLRRQAIFKKACKGVPYWMEGT